jgi:hypothetical protein
MPRSLHRATSISPLPEGVSIDVTHFTGQLRCWLHLPLEHGGLLQ